MAKVENMASLTAISKRYDDFTHEIGFTEHSLSQVLTIAGFDEVRIRPFRTPPIGVKSWMRGTAQTVQHAIWKLILRIEGGGQRIVAPALFVVARGFSDAAGSDLSATCEQ